jgi:hypothetical protein
MPPVIIPHYVAVSAALQKVRALLSRAKPQPRDVFDLYLLSSQPEVLEADLGQDIGPNAISQIRDTIYALEYQQYRDTVVSFLGAEDGAAYDSPQIWDEIRLRVLAMLEGVARDGQ